ncbi:hypothetical protein A2U01_0040552, partial [Trifolium medium]|nr:hypothetical protein [Trifolium medium]
GDRVKLVRAGKHQV